MKNLVHDQNHFEDELSRIFDNAAIEPSSKVWQDIDHRLGNKVENAFQTAFQDALLQPSDLVWQNIAKNLDAPPFEKLLKNTFENAELLPSDHLWKGISDQLDNSLENSLQKVFANAELEPSKNTWKGIAKNLDSSFENSLQKVFGKAELSPSKKVWQNIEKALLPANHWLSATIWKKIAVAAACVCLMLGGVYVFNSKKLPTAEKQVGKKTDSTNVPENLTKNSEQKNIAKNSVENAEILSNKNEKTTTTTFDNNFTSSKSINIVKVEKNVPSTKNQVKDLNAQENKIVQPTIIENLKLVDLSDFQTLAIDYNSKTPILTLVLPVAFQSENEKTEYAYFVGISGFANQYNPNFALTSANAYLIPSPFLAGDRLGDTNKFHNSLLDSVRNLSSYSFGIDFGKKLTSNFSLQTGVHYTASSFVIDHIVNQLPPKDSQFAGFGINFKNMVHSNTEWLSIPIKIVVQSDRKGLNYGISGGLSADILLANTLKSDLSFVQYNLGANNRLNLSANMGLTISYPLFDRLDIGAEMNYRKALNSLYQSDMVEAKPHWLSLGLGLKFKL
ncbi:MAG: hypothetical protein EAZ97_09180 [Bacteroidetes bacterium]|nr:MAG: hypothetical protein EAZ97_09180 [Bacteroidota bacterium]